MDEDRTEREKAFVAISSSVALTKENLLHVHMLKVLMHKIGNDRRISDNTECYTGLHCLRCLNLKKYCSMTKCSLSDDDISFAKSKNKENREISYLVDRFYMEYTCY